MILEIARPEDSWDLKQFFKNFTTGELIQFKIDRPRDFFTPYDIQSDTHVTYVLRKPEGRVIQGVATFVIRNVWLNQKIQTIAVARDLRILPSRQAILSWGQYFAPVLDEIKRAYHVDYFFSTLNMTDATILNTFIRPRQLKRPWPRYHLFRRFNLVSIHGVLPFTENPLPHMRIKKVDESLYEDLLYYIVNKKKQKELSSIYDKSSAEEFLTRWQGLKYTDFYVALDSNGGIIGCVAPWSAANIQEFIPYKYNQVAHNFRQFLKFGKWLGWTRTLTKPVNRLKREAPLNFRYLTCFLADNEDIFEALLWRVFNEIQPYEFLVYLQMRQDIHMRPPRGWIAATLPHGLYCLLPPEQEAPDFLHPSNENFCDWEAFWV
jgi:hypothetical protein